MSEQEEKPENNEIHGKERSLMNLRMFKRGDPRPPNAGIKKGQKHFQTLLNEVSQWDAPGPIIEKIKAFLPDAPEKLKLDLAEAITVHMKAIAGESWAYDRLHGKPKENIQINKDEDEKPFTDEELVAMSDALNGIDNGESKPDTIGKDCQTQD